MPIPRTSRDISTYPQSLKFPGELLNMVKTNHCDLNADPLAAILGHSCRKGSQGNLGWRYFSRLTLPNAALY